MPQWWLVNIDGRHAVRMAASYEASGMVALVPANLQRVHADGPPPPTRSDLDELFDVKVIPLTNRRMSASFIGRWRLVLVSSVVDEAEQAQFLRVLGAFSSGVDPHSRGVFVVANDLLCPLATTFSLAEERERPPLSPAVLARHPRRGGAGKPASFHEMENRLVASSDWMHDPTAQDTETIAVYALADMQPFPHVISLVLKTHAHWITSAIQQVNAQAGLSPVGAELAERNMNELQRHFIDAALDSVYETAIDAQLAHIGASKGGAKPKRFAGLRRRAARIKRRTGRKVNHWTGGKKKSSSSKTGGTKGTKGSHSASIPHTSGGGKGTHGASIPHTSGGGKHSSSSHGTSGHGSSSSKKDKKPTAGGSSGHGSSSSKKDKKPTSSGGGSHGGTGSGKGSGKKDKKPTPDKAKKEKKPSSNTGGGGGGGTTTNNNNNQQSGGGGKSSGGGGSSGGGSSGGGSGGGSGSGQGNQQGNQGNQQGNQQGDNQQGQPGQQGGQQGNQQPPVGPVAGGGGPGGYYGTGGSGGGSGGGGGGGQQQQQQQQQTNVIVVGGGGDTGKSTTVNTSQGQGGQAAPVQTAIRDLLYEWNAQHVEGRYHFSFGVFENGHSSGSDDDETSSSSVSSSSGSSSGSSSDDDDDDDDWHVPVVHHCTLSAPIFAANDMTLEQEEDEFISQLQAKRIAETAAYEALMSLQLLANDGAAEGVLPSSISAYIDSRFPLVRIAAAAAADDTSSRIALEHADRAWDEIRDAIATFAMERSTQKARSV